MARRLRRTKRARRTRKTRRRIRGGAGSINTESLGSVRNNPFKVRNNTAKAFANERRRREEQEMRYQAVVAARARSNALRKQPVERNRLAASAKGDFFTKTGKLNAERKARIMQREANNANKIPVMSNSQPNNSQPNNSQPSAADMDFPEEGEFTSS